MKPTPEFQLEFLTKVQRLFSEGEFTATYKFALLIAIADISVELGQENEQTLEISYKHIGLKFIELYWQQATPYSGDEVLVQNRGIQSAIVTAIADYRRHNLATSFNAARSAKEFPD